MTWVSVPRTSVPQQVRITLHESTSDSGCRHNNEQNKATVARAPSAPFFASILDEAVSCDVHALKALRTLGAHVLGLS